LGGIHFPVNSGDHHKQVSKNEGNEHTSLSSPFVKAVAKPCSSSGNCIMEAGRLLWAMGVHTQTNDQIIGMDSF
jgi:hypothetical protein